MTDGVKKTGNVPEGYKLLDNGMMVKGRCRVKTDKDGNTIIKGNNLNIFGTENAEKVKIITNNSVINLQGGGDNATIIGRKNTIFEANSEQNKDKINNININGSQVIVDGDSETDVNAKGLFIKATGRYVVADAESSSFRGKQVYICGEKNEAEIIVPD